MQTANPWAIRRSLRKLVCVSAQLGLILALGAGAAEAAALLTLEVESKARDLELGGASDLYDPAPVSATQGPLSDSYAAAVPVLAGMDASAFVRATVDYGLMRAEAIALVGGHSTESSAQARATVGFSDDLVFSGAPAGSQGTAHLILLVDGNASISLTHPADSGASVDAEVRLSAVSSLGSFSDIESLATPGGYIAGWLEVDVPFVFGDVVRLFGELDLRANALADGGDQPGVNMVAAAVSDFWSTARWGGISDVRDASGNSLASWSVTSASGTDYSRAFPVPEPRLGALLALVALISVVSRRVVGRTARPARRGFGAALLALATLASESEAASILNVYAEVNEPTGGGTQHLACFYFEDCPNGPAQDPVKVVSVGGFAYPSGGSSNATAYAEAAYGLVRARVFVSNGSTDGSGGISARAIASFEDDLWISGGTPGTLGKATLNIILDGSIFLQRNHSEPTASQVETTASFAAASSPNFREFDSRLWDLRSTTPGFQQISVVDEVLTVTIDFEFGKPITISAGFNQFAQAGVPGLGAQFYQVSAESDFASTLRWGGISDVRDANGNSLASWSVTSASGTDYSRAFPVPEPRLGALLGLALIGSHRAGAARTRRSGRLP